MPPVFVCLGQINLVNGTTTLLTLVRRSSGITGEDIPAPAGASHLLLSLPSYGFWRKWLDILETMFASITTFFKLELSLLYSSE